MVEYLVSHRITTGEWSYPRRYIADDLDDLRYKLIWNGSLDRYKALRIEKSLHNSKGTSIGYLEQLQYRRSCQWMPGGSISRSGAKPLRGDVYVIWFNHEDAVRGGPTPYNLIDTRDGKRVRGKFLWPTDRTGDLMGRRQEIYRYTTKKTVF